MERSRQSVCEVYPAFVTWMTKRSSPRLSIQEKRVHRSQASPRHEMEVKLCVWAHDKMVRSVRLIFIRCLIQVLMENMDRQRWDCPDINQSRCIPADWRHTGFDYDVVYTNLQAAGAYRGLWGNTGNFCAGICSE